MSSNTGFGKRVGGAPCLDFVNTVRGRVGNPASRGGRDYVDRIVGERLVSYEALLSWAVFAGVMTSAEVKWLTQELIARPQDGEAVLSRAIVLREALYRTFKAAIEGWSPRPEDLDIINRELLAAREHERLVASPRFAVTWIDSRGSLDRMLWPIVRSAADLLTGPALARVGQCPGDECGWLFLDTSRSRRRQWCDMGECGNVAKVRRFRQRQRAVRPRRAETSR